MYVRFFDDENNRDLVSSVLIEFDNARIQAMLMSLPTAMRKMTAQLPNQPILGSNDYYREEQIFRKALNNVIQLSNLLQELLDVVMTHKTFLGMDHSMLEDVIEDSKSVFRRLQQVKDVRIKQIHEKDGPNFGSATGFQTTNYNDYARKLDEWMQEQLV